MFLSRADLFGYSLQPTFMGKSKINTVLGGVVSILLVILFGVGFFFEGREIIEKKNPISNVSAIVVDNAAISLEQIPMFFAAISDEGAFLHLDKAFNRAVTLGARLYEVATSDNGEFEFSYYHVPLVLCTKELMGEEYYNVAKKAQAGIDYALCVDFKNVTAPNGSKHSKGIPQLKNPFGNQNSAHLNVFFKMCQEELDPGCRAGIEAVGSFNFAISHPQEIVNISDNSNPISKSFKSISTSVSLGLAFSQTINFNVNELVSDEGWVVQRDNTKTFYTADPSIYNATQYSESDRVLGRCIFAVNLTKNNISRRYMKLQELVANLGGFVKITMLIFSFILKKYSKWTLYKQICKTEKKLAISNQASSGVMINNMTNSSVSRVISKVKQPTFFQFVLASLNKTKAKKYKVNWNESVKYLDFAYVKKQFEELDLLIKTNNTPNIN